VICPRPDCWRPDSRSDKLSLADLIGLLENAVEILAWLRELGLERYEQAFRENEVAADILPKLTADDLKDIGVTIVGHRRKLLEAIAALAEPALARQAGPSAPVKALTAARPTEAERRQLTVMFVDLVGSTALSAALDPEEMGAAIRVYQNAVAGETLRFEGHIAKFMGDGVLAYFGWPQAHEDDAERAVRAGLALVQTVAALEVAGRRLAARIGIATGLVVVGERVGEGEAQERAVVGETPNLAARLQALAPPGSVVISQATRRLVGDLFELTDLGPTQIKGFAEPVAAFQVQGEGSADGRFEALHGHRLTPLIGRENQLAMLLERWSWAKDGDGQVVLIAGEAGIGKSRLLRALREKLTDEPHIAISHLCSAYHTNSALHPIVAQLERAADFASHDEPADRLAKLEALLAQGAEQLDEATPLFGALLGVPTDERYRGLNLTPQRQKQRTFEVLIEQLAGLARKRPVLQLYEDLHWADPSTLELLDMVVERARVLPVLIVMTHRPQFTPPWSGQAHVTALPLNRLGRRQGAAMALQVTGGKALPPEILDQILERTDGVPLFLEELTRTMLESGLLTDAGDHYELAGPLPPLAIPANLHDSLMARLDRLATVKELAQIGAVIGREFSHELLAVVADRPQEQLEIGLDQLVDSELVFRRGSPPDATYSFKHALVKDAAYQSLLKSRRQQLHARVAQVFEERFPGVVETQPELLAYHLTEAGLDAPAADAWARAGRAALGRSAMREAANSLSRAVGLLRGMPSSPDRQRLELELLGGLGVALTNTLGPASSEAQAAHERADHLSQELGDREGRFRARWNLWRVYNVRAEFDSAVAAGDALLAEAQADGDADHEVQARHALFASRLFRGDLEATCHHVDHMLALYEVGRHGTQALTFGGHDARECGLTQSSTALFLLGYPERALARNAEGIAHAMALGQPQVVVHAHNWGSMLLQLVGELEELDRRTILLARLVDEHGLAIYYPEARILAAWRAVQEERDHRAAEEMRNFLDRRAAMGTVSIHTYFLMLLADAWLRLDRPDEALAAIKEGLARAEAKGEHLCTAELHRLRARACLARNAPDAQVAEAALAAALAAARHQSSRIFELRAACDLARLWADRGERRNAHNLLAPIYGWFTEGFKTADLKDAKALLGELA
jgi:class 3 adenylate cyclase/predicted ATPase